MRPFSVSIIVAILIAVTGSTAEAERHVLPKAKISIDLPSSWTIARDKRGLFARSTDGDVALVFWETHKADFKVIDDAERRLAMSDLRWSAYEGSEVKHGISWSLRNTGTATVAKTSMHARLWVGGGKNEKIGVYVLVAAKPDKTRSADAMVDAILDSLRYKR